MVDGINKKALPIDLKKRPQAINRARQEDDA
jgi:hypothetical protein